MNSIPKNRLLHANSILENNALLPFGIYGSESISTPFDYSIECLLTDPPDHLNKFLTTPLCIAMRSDSDKPYYKHGIITQINELNTTNQFLIKIKPWISQLKQGKQSRVFQNMSVPDICASLFNEHNFYDFTFSKLSQPHSKLRYIVQYQESDFHFISRLLEQSDIFYYYEHQKDRHIIHFVDSMITFPLNESTEIKPQYTSQYALSTTGISNTVQAQINNPQLQTGQRIKFKNNRLTFLITHCKIKACDKTYLNDTTPSAQLFKNTITGSNAAQPIPVEKHFHKPCINGLQIATVVGPAGQEIHLDQHGRIKIQFHWDRLGEHNANSSCWIPVLQTQTGNNWGAMFIPRVGHHVIVGFENGDIDKPMIVDSTYNQHHQLAYNLPHGAYGNELTFIDKKGEEKIVLRAQKDFIQKINNNNITTVNNHHTTTIKHGDYQLTAHQGSITTHAAQKIQLRVKDSFITLEPNNITFSSEIIHLNPDE